MKTHKAIWTDFKDGFISFSNKFFRLIVWWQCR